MCTKNDIDAVLEKLQHCHDHEEKRKMLEQFISCETCGLDLLVKGDIRCIRKHVEFINTIEHVIKHRFFEK